MNNDLEELLDTQKLIYSGYPTHKDATPLARLVELKDKIQQDLDKIPVLEHNLDAYMDDHETLEKIREILKDCELKIIEKQCTTYQKIKKIFDEEKQ